MCELIANPTPQDLLLLLLRYGTRPPSLRKTTPTLTGRLDSTSLSACSPAHRGVVFELMANPTPQDLLLLPLRHVTGLLPSFSKMEFTFSRLDIHFSSTMSPNITRFRQTTNKCVNAITRFRHAPTHGTWAGTTRAAVSWMAKAPRDEEAPTEGLPLSSAPSCCRSG